MAYTAATLDCLIPRTGAGPAFWMYTTEDAHTDVDAAAYFSDGAARGLVAGDVMVVIDTNAPTCTIHQVASTTAIDAARLDS